MVSHLAWWGTIVYIVILVSWHHSIVGNIVMLAHLGIELYNETSTLAAIVDVVLVASVGL